MEKGNDLARMLMDFANLAPTQGSIHRLQGKWPGLLPDGPLTQFNIEFHMEEYEPIPEQLHYILRLRDIIRRLWIGDPKSASLLEPLLLSGQMGLRSFGITADLGPVYEKFAAPSPLPDIIRIDWKRRAFVYRPQTLLQEVLYFLLQNSHKTRVCANADCPASYFIAPRANTRYCSQDCVDAIKRQAKREWWASSGEEWRAKKKAEKPGKRRSR